MGGLLAFRHGQCAGEPFPAPGADAAVVEEGVGRVGVFAGAGDAAGLFLEDRRVWRAGRPWEVGGDGRVAVAGARGEGGWVEGVGVVVVVGGGGAHVEGGEVVVVFCFFGDGGGGVVFREPRIGCGAGEVGEAILTLGKVLFLCRGGDPRGGLVWDGERVLVGGARGSRQSGAAGSV